MKIGEAARRVGVEVHVLRHWNDERVVVPDRAASGHREYSEEHVRRLRVVQACRNVGMSLAEIRLVLHRGYAERTRVIEGKLRWIREQRARLGDAERFLEHVVDCTHDLLTRCEDCTAYAATVPEPVDGTGPDAGHGP
ncbi:MerR family transcriptional regulator [Pseudonocardia sp. ICBG601]|uniref:helix-turn-helix domain-containing protein n=1 Tax=Pseudonocardia sp. ICBG601 TaxID=2846759 RepID=UPI001CF60A2E|nr:MerR family transcriptional regulator [Pseudonocardia sp. ICBG601]